ALDLARQRRRRFVHQRDRRRLQQQSRRREFGREVGGPNAGDRAAHFRQRVARDLLRLGDLEPRRGRVAGQQLARELQLERDQRQRVPEQVVQVAADALALGGGRQPPHLVLRQPQRRVLLLVGDV